MRDINIRKVLNEDLGNTRRNLQALSEYMPADVDVGIMDALQRLIMDIQSLDKKVTLSPVGAKYLTGDGRYDADRETNRKLRSFDRRLTERSSILVKATSALNDRYLDDQIGDPMMELNKIRKFLTDLRNDVEHREDMIKGVRF